MAKKYHRDDEAFIVIKIIQGRLRFWTHGIGYDRTIRHAITYRTFAEAEKTARATGGAVMAQVSPSELQSMLEFDPETRPSAS